MSRRYRASVLIAVGVAVALVLVAKHLRGNAPGRRSGIEFDGGLPVLIEFGAGKCTSCKMMEPVLEELRRRHASELRVEYVDVRENPAPSRAFEIRVIPAQVFCDADGKELFRHQGFFGTDDIVAKWRELGVPLSAPTEEPQP